MAARYGELDTGLRGPGAGVADESATAATSSASKSVNALLSICGSERENARLWITAVRGVSMSQPEYHGRDARAT